MSKRELEALATVDIDAPRTKRRKEASEEKPSQSIQTRNTTHKTDDGMQSDDGETEEDAKLRVVREQGMLIYNKLKDAVGPECVTVSLNTRVLPSYVYNPTHHSGRDLAFDFHHLPSKRVYPDYYDKIKRPVALGQIKSRLDAEEYTTLNEVKHDLEQCFRNAKRYNRKDSQIWKDAKALHVRCDLAC